jgi:hypothetical protein
MLKFLNKPVFRGKYLSMRIQLSLGFRGFDFSVWLLQQPRFLDTVLGSVFDLDELPEDLKDLP